MTAVKDTYRKTIRYHDRITIFAASILLIILYVIVVGIMNPHFFSWTTG